MSALTLAPELDAKPRLSFMQITPAMAERWLARNHNNRRPRPSTIARYARDMAAGNWRLDASPIKFAADGTLLDGQHRLFAICQSGATVTTAVATGLDPATQSVMDTGKARTAADALGIAGEKNGSAIAAAARFGLQVENDDFSANVDWSHEEIAEYIEDNPDLRHSIDVVLPLARRTDCPPAVVIYSHMILNRLDPFEAAQFWIDAADKIGLKAGDPVLAMTARFAEARRSREKLTRAEYLSVVYRAWNCRRAGKQLRVVRINSPKGGSVAIPEPK